MAKKGKKQFARSVAFRKPMPQLEPQPATTTTQVNLSFYEAYTLALKEWKLAQIILAGCGGIGAHLADHIGRIIWVLSGLGVGVNLSLVDPDVVEEKNIGRQRFCPAEIGIPKAVALARRLSQAYGVNTMAYQAEYSENLILPTAQLVLLVGCVDNYKARRALSDTLAQNPEEPTPHALPRIWWVDCGNLKDTGRVLVGSAHQAEQVRGAFREKKRCISLPSPSLQYPSLLMPQREDVETREMSCAELAAANMQSLNINAAIAVQAADILTRLLITHDLKRYQCAVNVASGSVKSFYITPEEIAREIEKPANYVICEDQPGGIQATGDHQLQAVVA
ncbi:MAG TPA: ThiF family adenylyltransferase [Pyrinomonadaceae bacterium]|jgi:PRTRC genetic system ThiF family protein